MAKEQEDHISEQRERLEYSEVELEIKFWREILGYYV